MVKNFAGQFTEVLTASGVKWLYDLVGGSLNELPGSPRRKDKVEWVHVRHKEGHGLRWYLRANLNFAAVADAAGAALAHDGPMMIDVVVKGTAMSGTCAERVDLAKTKLWR